jgi:hypothetical protein
VIPRKRKLRDRRWRERDAAHQRAPVEKEIKLADRQRDRIVAILAP